MKFMILGFLSVLLVACGPVERDSGSEAEGLEETTGAVASCHNFAVDFTGCREFVGIGSVPAANARPLVPAHYTLAGDATNAVIVVRGAECGGTAVDGKKPYAAHVSQIGISLTGADTTADINNYLLWYATDLGVLHAKLTAAGVAADNDQSLAFQFTPTSPAATSGTLRVAASPPHGPAYQAQGTAIVPTAAPVQFIATWWQDGKKGTVQMRTTFPNIQFGSSTMTLTTPAGSELARLIGGASLTFPFLDSFNAIPTAHMTVCGS